jgi:hypothetical protein
MQRLDLKDVREERENRRELTRLRQDGVRDRKRRPYWDQTWHQGRCSTRDKYGHPIFYCQVSKKNTQGHTKDKPGSDKMSDCKDSTEKDANTTDDDVGDAEEGIASSDNGSGRDDDGLGTLVLSSREIWHGLDKMS